MRNLLTVFSVIMLGCTQLVIPEKEITYTEIFDQFYQDLSSNNPFICDLEADFDSLYHVYRDSVPKLEDSRDVVYLFWDFLYRLNDGHSQIKQGDYFTRSRYHYIYYFVPTIFADLFLEDGYKTNPPVTYGFVKEDHSSYGTLPARLGYLHIADFHIPTESAQDQLAEALSYLKECEFIFFDLRGNLGGNAVASTLLASCFIKERLHIGYTQIRNGPEYCSFTDPMPLYLEPNETFIDMKTVYVGTDHNTTSGGTWTAFHFTFIPNAVLVGSESNGAWSATLEKTLPNGWAYSQSQYRCLSPDLVPLEGNGVIPDIRVERTQIISGVDSVLCAVIEDIRKKAE